MVAHEVRPLAVLGDRGERLERAPQRARIFAREREVHGLVDGERQDHLELVAVLVAEELALLRRREVDLAHEHRLAGTAADVAPHVPQQLVRVLTRAGVRAGRLDQERHGVDAEPAQPLLEPEADHLRDLVAHLRVRDVQVRLVRVEAVLVPAPRLLVEGPVRVLLVGEHDVAGLLLRLLVAPDVEVVEGRLWPAPRLLEPRVLVGGVVDDEVGDHADAALARGAHHVGQVAVRAEPRVDPVEVGDVVAVVALTGRHERHQPDAVDAEARQVVDPLAQARQVAAAVAVPVQEGLDVEAVEDRVLPPDVARDLAPHG